MLECRRSEISGQFAEWADDLPLSRNVDIDEPAYSREALRGRDTRDAMMSRALERVSGGRRVIYQPDFAGPLHAIVAASTTIGDGKNGAWVLDVSAVGKLSLA